MNIWSNLFGGAASRERHRSVEAEIQRLVATRRDTIQVAQSSARVMTTLAGAMQLMAQEAVDNDP